MTAVIAADRVAPTPAAVSIIAMDQSYLDGREMSAIANSRRQADSHVLVTEGEGRKFVEAPRYLSSDQQLKASIKRFEKMSLALKNWPVDEVMFLVSGKVEITDLAGHSRVFGPGSSWVLPKGFSGTWKQLSAVNMFTVEYGAWK